MRTTSASIFAFDSGGKYSATYSRPIASPIACSDAVTARFQRTRSSCAPVRNFVRNSQRASEKRFDSSGAAPSTTWKASYDFSVSTGVAAKSAASFGSAVFCRTTTRSAFSIPASLK
jgi:hypothetical protein